MKETTSYLYKTSQIVMNSRPGFDVSSAQLQDLARSKSTGVMPTKAKCGAQIKQRPKTDQWLKVSLKTHSGYQVTNVY